MRQIQFGSTPHSDYTAWHCRLKSSISTIRYSEEPMKKIIVLFLVLSTYPNSGLSQQGNRATPLPARYVLVKAGRFLDVRNERALENQAILIENDRIRAVGSIEDISRTAPKDAHVIDLSKATVLPGFSDCHTHVLLQGDVTAED